MFDQCAVGGGCQYTKILAGVNCVSERVNRWSELRAVDATTVRGGHLELDHGNSEDNGSENVRQHLKRGERTTTANVEKKAGGEECIIFEDN